MSVYAKRTAARQAKLPYARGERFLTRINSSEHGEPGNVICTRGGLVVWVGAIGDLAGVDEFDVIHCHDADIVEVTRMLYRSAAALSAHECSVTPERAGDRHTAFSSGVQKPSTTIDFARALGFRTLPAVCPQCGLSFFVPFSMIDLPGDTLLASIPARSPILCPKCWSSCVVDVGAIGLTE